VDSYKITREDAMVFVGGIILLIGLFAFPWYSVSFLGDIAATSSPYAIWGIFAPHRPDRGPRRPGARALQLEHADSRRHRSAAT